MYLNFLVSMQLWSHFIPGILAIASTASSIPTFADAAAVAVPAEPSSFVIGSDTEINGFFSEPLALWDLDGSLNSYANSSHHAPVQPLRTSQLVSALFPKLYNAWIQAGEKWSNEYVDAMQSLTDTRYINLNSSVGCTDLPNCTVNNFKLSPGVTRLVGEAIAHLPVENANDVARVWPRYADAINHILDVYGNGAPAMHEEDDNWYNVTSPTWSYEMQGLREYYLEVYPMAPFDAIYMAMDLLDANDQIDAISFANISHTTNAPAISRAHQLTNWSSYEYAAIIIPGQGPDNLQSPLSYGGKLRLKFAAQMFLSNTSLAPFIMPSGGNVHPGHTTHNEGENMRSWLIEQYQIPEDRIIVEPHARHTTTNLRNAARDLMELKYPKNKKLLVVTNPSQRDYINSEGFSNRSQVQLGYSLGKIGPVVEPWGVEYIPSEDVTFIDPIDPLDP